MRIRIIKQARGTVVGIRLDRYRPGRVYDLGAGLAEYLVAEGYAIVEMRDEDHPNLEPHEKRRKIESRS